MRHFQPSGTGSFRLRFHHGLYCVGCCRVLMVLLFVAGAKNVAWILVLAAVVIAAKARPGGRSIARGVGLGSVAAGISFVLR